MSLKPVLPVGWYDEYFEKADLDASYGALEGIDHFYAEAMRGHIRSQQLRLEEAAVHFEHAQEDSRDVSEDIPTLVRVFMLGTFIFDNALLRGPACDVESIPDVWIPYVPDRVLREYPEVRLVIFLRRTTEGLFRLYMGQCDKSAEIFEDLIADDGDAPEDVLATYYMGLAASYHNLGRQEDAARFLSSAALTVQVGGRLLNRVHMAGWLYAYTKYTGSLEESDSWKVFIERLGCPQATVDAFLRRGEIMVERCCRESRLVLI